MNESPADKDRWEFNLPEDAQVFGQYITDNGLYYILDDWKTSVYRGRKEEKLNSFKLEGDDKHSNIFDSKITQLGYDDQIYIANANYNNQNNVIKQLNVYRLSEKASTIESVLDLPCQSTTHCKFTAPFLFSEDNKSLFTLRQDGDKSYLTQTSLGNSNINWHEIDFDSIVTAAVISKDQKFMYLQGSSQFYVVNLENGYIQHQDHLPPEIRGNDHKSNVFLTQRSDDNDDVFGFIDDKLFKLSLFNDTASMKLKWAKKIKEKVKGIARSPKNNTVYAWSDSSNLIYIAKDDELKSLRLLSGPVKEVIFNPDNGWAYILSYEFTGKDLQVYNVSPSGNIIDIMLMYYVDKSVLHGANITWKNNILAIGVEDHVYNYQMKDLVEFVDTGEYIEAKDLEQDINTINWGVGISCDICGTAEKNSIRIDDANEIMRNEYHWPLVLATHVNKNSDLVKIGEKNDRGEIIPLASKYRNKIWIMKAYSLQNYKFNYQLATDPELISSWKLNSVQSAINAKTFLPVGNKIIVSVKLPSGSERNFPFTVTRGSIYQWPYDLALFINEQAKLNNFPIGAGERLSGDQFVPLYSSYRNALWVPESANEKYSVRYSIIK